MNKSELKKLYDAGERVFAIGGTSHYDTWRMDKAELVEFDVERVVGRHPKRVHVFKLLSGFGGGARDAYGRLVLHRPAGSEIVLDSARFVSQAWSTYAAAKERRDAAQSAARAGDAKRLADAHVAESIMLEHGVGSAYQITPSGFVRIDGTALLDLLLRATSS